MTSFSGHMLQHMGLMLFVPPFIVAAAPVLLALRTTPARTDGSRGAREWLLAVFQSRYSHFLTRPAIAGVLFAGSMVVFYYSPAFEFALRSHLGHTLMCVHFLLTGYLFTWVIIGIDPGAGRASYPFRLIMMLVTLTFHAFFGLALMTDTQLLAPTWWTDLGLHDADAPPTSTSAEVSRGEQANCRPSRSRSSSDTSGRKTTAKRASAATGKPTAMATTSSPSTTPACNDSRAHPHQPPTPEEGHPHEPTPPTERPHRVHNVVCLRPPSGRAPGGPHLERQRSRITARRPSKTPA